jgi:hydrogenase maturation factor
VSPSIAEALRYRLNDRSRPRLCKNAQAVGRSKPGGNPTARRLMSETLDIIDANWRGIGTIPRSGYAWKPQFGLAYFS